MTTIHEPTLLSNASSIYEPAPEQESEDTRMELFSPRRIAQFDLGSAAHFSTPEDSFEEALAFSPTKKGQQHRSSIALRGIKIEPEQWRTMEIPRPLMPQTPSRPPSVNFWNAAQEESVEQQAIRFIEALELRNFELENKIKGLEAKKANH